MSYLDDGHGDGLGYELAREVLLCGNIGCDDIGLKFVNPLPSSTQTHIAMKNIGFKFDRVEGHRSIVVTYPNGEESEVNFSVGDHKVFIAIPWDRIRGKVTVVFDFEWIRQKYPEIAQSFNRCPAFSG